jgi:predicted RNase H-like HicB family nuclease
VSCSSARFSIIIEPLGESDGGGFLATVPDVPGCMSDGATGVEALENAHDAIEAWIEQARAMGRAIPTPTRQRIHA